MRTKSFRRHQEKYKKKRATRKIRDWNLYTGELTPRDIGIAYSTHCRSCSCAMCGNPRKHLRVKSVKELSQDEIDDIEEKEI